MTPEQFITKWQAAELKERSAAQEHFIDLCRMLDEETPAEADPKGEWYSFERGASKTSGGDGWADVWRRGCFGWEYKGKRKSLVDAYAQLQQYAVALENPPLLIVCDLERFEIHTNWTNTVAEIHTFSLDGLRDAGNLEKLKWVFSDPERLKPRLTRDALTAEAAAQFAEFAYSLSARGHDPLRIAHFVNRLVFCMFAEDVNLLPSEMFTRMLEHSFAHPDEFVEVASGLFEAMGSGGRVGFEKVEWFNGGLFDDAFALPLTRDEITLVLSAAKMNWAEIDPSIFGTLFERGLDPKKRSQLGAHYTAREKIMRIVEPVVVRPLEREWSAAQAAMQGLINRAESAKSKAAKSKNVNRAEAIYRSFLDRLRSFVVLDPACGSGNFLYLSLLALKDLEHRVGLDAEAMGFAREFPRIGPESVRGIELSPYAAELARVTCWIGEIQWMKRNGYDVSRNPILRDLDNIQCRDAILAEDGTEAHWPAATVVVGNPPFLGCKKMFSVLGEEYTRKLRDAYQGRVSGFSDLVCFWWENAWTLVAEGKLERAGLVATNSIRGGANRRTLDRALDAGLVIYDAWDEEDWEIDGAAVDVSLACIAREASERKLDGVVVQHIYSDLSSGDGGTETDLSLAHALPENEGIAFNGIVKGGLFEVPGGLARDWLTLENPHLMPNSDVLFPWPSGEDVTRRPRDMWIIDFGEMDEAQASLYEAPFKWVAQHVKPVREKSHRPKERRYWWRFSRPGDSMKHAISGLSRFPATAEVAKHRVFVWLHKGCLPDKNIVVFASSSDVMFGILHSRFHRVWSLRLGTSLENRPRYTSSTTFRTYPFPNGLRPHEIAGAPETPQAVRIEEAARNLDQMRTNWLYPPSLVNWTDEVAEGYPKRPFYKDDAARETLSRRTLTALYNEMPTWLAKLHEEIDRAVAIAYGWPETVTDEEALKKLLALNIARASNQP